MVIWDSVRAWKPVIGYKGFYEVSNLGDVRALKRKVWKSDPHMKDGGCWQVRKARPACVVDKTHKKGTWEGTIPYKETHLCRDGKVKIFQVHRLVWAAFHKKDIPEGYHIDHMDNDPSNNHLDNLQCLNPRDHKRTTLERTHDVKILDQYWNEEDQSLKARGLSVHLSKAYHDGYAQALKDLQGV